MKNLIKRSLIALCAFAIMTIPSYAYSDVSSDHPHYEAIEVLSALELLPAGDTFRPDELVKMPEFYQFLITYAQAETNNDGSTPFTDLPSDSPYAPYVKAAIDLNILTPQGLTPKIKPNLTVTKAQSLEVIFDTFGIGVDKFFDKTFFPFSDIDPNSKRAAIAVKAAELGIFEEDPTKFRVAKRITRGELAEYLYSVYLGDFTLNNFEFEIPVFEIPAAPALDDSILDDPNFPIFLDVVRSLRDSYLYSDEDDITNENLIYQAIEGILENVSDVYTNFQDPEEAKLLLQSITPEDYEGIGAYLESVDEQITVVSPLKDSPAEKAGLLPNDIILSVDGESVEGLSVEAAAFKVRGPAGSDVTLKIRRGQKELSITITRGVISQTTVNSSTLQRLGKEIAYIEITNFGENTRTEFSQAVSSFNTEEIEGYIIDLRNNPGGFLDVAIDLVSYFAGGNRAALKLKYSDGSIETLTTTREAIISSQKEVVVLINEGSASASEIMAGALQDYDLATIIGTKSFGKGSVQQLSEYSNGALLKYTISEWLTPDEHPVNGVGITPDIVIENTTEGIDAQLNRALEQF